VERFVAVQEEQSDLSHPTIWESPKLPFLALRTFRPARQLHIQVNEGCPVTMASAGKEADAADLKGTILWSAGPWRASGDWWTEQPKGEGMNEEIRPWDREEWDVALCHESSGNVALYRIYRDMSNGRWFADASYD